jgi:hypothetical protein
MLNEEAKKIVDAGYEGMIEVEWYQNKQGYYSKLRSYDLREEHLRGKHVIYIYMTDNVLDEEDWTLACVRINPDTGDFLEVSVIQQGVYSVPICRNFKELIEKARSDPSGSHPECYFQVMTWQFMGNAHMCWQMTELQKKHFGFSKECDK